ncbi:hypothetical protein HZF08_01830 [Paenibacillus sp. CGMCC 1.16610]|uniref:Uncharacterized protein n=1 Tax=Paenibacillus anseongense TaxID=2682845 RepID=A0ABW9U031_9BACL|nr:MULTISPECIES: hypothetical protein [Paenibacillus]MBA2937040.1 hypothetical protein [Paenibacillus sp. CGMCC 1.16610]MVQ33363.1 hypothetical protein [Paenibacillus anseongense]
MKSWVNIDTPLKTYTVHLDHEEYPYVLEMKQKSKQGWKKQQGTGGWKSFLSKEEALDIYEINHKGKLKLIECGHCKQLIG